MNTTPETNSKEPDVKAVRSASEKSTDQFSAFTDQFLKTMEGVSKLAEKGPSNFLLTLGSVLFIVALAMKFKVFGAEVSNLQPTEFITIILAGLFLILAGTYLRFYQFVSQQKLGKEFSTKMVDIAEKALGFAKDTVDQQAGNPKVIL